MKKLVAAKTMMRLAELTKKLAVVKAMMRLADTFENICVGILSQGQAIGKCLFIGTKVKSPKIGSKIIDILDTLP